MVSNPKRMRYVSENDFTSSEGEGSDDGNYTPERRKDSRKAGGGKWLSKNALNARENRLKKKIYVTNLEKQVSRLKTENDSFSKVIENQSVLITDLKKEIKYLKSVIANSTDIGNLMKNIHRNTGMSVTTSLDQSLSMNYVSKPKQAIARKTAHPWEEKRYPSYPTPESDLFSNSDKIDLESDFLKDVELDEFLGGCDFVDPTSLEVSENNHLKEHNYTSVDDEDNVGVCLHVSKHRVSLEFCSTCSDNASQSWNH